MNAFEVCNFSAAWKSATEQEKENKKNTIQNN